MRSLQVDLASWMWLVHAQETDPRSARCCVPKIEIASPSRAGRVGPTFTCLHVIARPGTSILQNDRQFWGRTQGAFSPCTRLLSPLWGQPEATGPLLEPELYSHIWPDYQRYTIPILETN